LPRMIPVSSQASSCLSMAVGRKSDRKSAPDTTEVSFPMD
jgi:hypothetical protein